MSRTKVRFGHEHKLVPFHTPAQKSAFDGCSSELCERIVLNLGSPRKDRRFVPSVNSYSGPELGVVHLNVLAPGALAGNHFHERVEELFINAGPGELRLHLRDPNSDRRETIPMMPASLDRVIGYRPRCGIAHAVENLEATPLTLIIVVQEDDPSDVVPYPVKQT